FVTGRFPVTSVVFNRTFSVLFAPSIVLFVSVTAAEFFVASLVLSTFPSNTSFLLTTTIPVFPLTLCTAFATGIFCHTLPLLIIWSPIAHELIPSILVDPATLTDQNHP